MSPSQRGLRYVLVGGWNTAFGFGMFVALHALLIAHVHYLAILVLSTTIAVLNAFVCYRLLVFKVTGTPSADLARFSVVYLVALAANLALLPLLVEVVGLTVLLAQGVVVAGTVVASFFAHSRFSFRRVGGADPST